MKGKAIKRGAGQPSGGPSSKTVSFRPSPEVRRLVELLAARLTMTCGRMVTISEVLEAAVRKLGEDVGLVGEKEE